MNFNSVDFSYISHKLNKNKSFKVLQNEEKIKQTGKKRDFKDPNS